MSLYPIIIDVTVTYVYCSAITFHFSETVDRSFSNTKLLLNETLLFWAEHDGARRALGGADVFLRGPGAVDGGTGGSRGRRPRGRQPDLPLT